MTTEATPLKYNEIPNSLAGTQIDNIVLESVDYHRNGVCGNGFHVVCFRWAEKGDEPRPMVGVVFEQPGSCAVLDREMTRRADITFAMGNSWRGDHFEPSLRKAIELLRSTEHAWWEAQPKAEKT